MPADRTQSRDKRRNAHAGPSTSTMPDGRKKPLPLDKRDPQGIPGVSKLKASIRQTKRFLAKDNLEPGLRITTERRLVSLESDLASAQRRGVEKKNGAKYHQVKFFEKRKLLRIIKRLKRTLADDTTVTDKKGRKKAEKELGQARVMLNYVRHYPNTQKYIALFANSDSDSVNELKDDDDGEGEGGKVLKLPKVFKDDEPTSERRQTLDRMREMMERGELPKEPELVTATATAEKHGRVQVDVDGGAGKQAVAVDGNKKKGKKEVVAEADDFFDDEDDEDE